MIPEIAIIGHPNEGKSSVVSTLAEDDSVAISSFPGETRQCRSFPVILDGREILRFTDTPGFQNPSRLLAELKNMHGTSSERIRQLTTLTASEAELRDDHELLQPLGRGACVIYVVDGSRPLRHVDKVEMEILRLIGKPRMAVINPKQEQEQFLEAWKDELAKHFNSCRVFNAHHATYRERIDLLEALKAIDQDWQHLIAEVIGAIEKDWAARNRTCARIIGAMLTDALTLQLQKALSKTEPESGLRNQLVDQYTALVAGYETRAHQKMRGLFKHNLFNCALPVHSILHEDLFSEKTWQLLGLTKKQLLLLGGMSGVAIGAGFEVAALGHGLGLFTAVGGAVGGAVGTVGALLGRKYLKTRASLLGVRLAGPQLQIGPADTITLLFILINRALLYYEHISNWAHGRRDYVRTPLALLPAESPAFTKNWPPQYLKTSKMYFKSLRQANQDKRFAAEKQLQEILFASLLKISREERG